MITPPTIILSPASAAAQASAAGPAAQTTAGGATPGTPAAAGTPATNALAPALLAGLAPGARLDGVIAGRDPWGRPLLTTARGTFSVAGLAAAPIGSRVTLEVRRAAGRLEAVLVSIMPRDGTGAGDRADQRMLAERWTTLERALQSLPPGQQGPGDTRQLAASGQLAAHLVMIIRAVRTRDLGSLLGREALRALETAGGQSLLRDLGAELERLEGASREPWRALFLPLREDDEVRMLRLFVRRQRDDDAAEDADDAPTQTRFIIETDMRRLGPLQLDGLLAEKRLDIVFRTHTPVPTTWQTDLRALVSATSHAYDIAGTLVFQTHEQFPVQPLAELRPAGNDGLFA